MEKDGRRCSTDLIRAEVPLHPVEKIMVRQAVALQPMDDHSGADTLQPMEDPHAVAEGRALREAAACGEPTQEQAPGRTCSLWGTHAGAVCEGMQPMEEPHAGAG